ncbi:MAG: tetratricopeptide repeat protein [Vampirovibrionales bacterium]|nr:tetratricopeptide repeat protein [Vampirovibrionales bacterium]
MRFNRALPVSVVLACLFVNAFGGVLQVQAAEGASAGVSPQAQVYYQQALDAEKQNQSPEIVEPLLRKALGLAPKHPLYLIRLASLLNQTGRPKEAISLYTQAQQVLPSDPMIPFSIGSLYEQQGDLATASYYYDQGVRQAPEYAFGLLNLARVQALQGQLQPALQAYNAFLSQYPNHYDAQRYRAYVLMEMNQFADAATAFEQLRATNPGRFTDSVSLARALTRSNQATAALAVLNEVTPEESKKRDVALTEAEARISLGQNDAAVVAYQKAIEADPDNDDLLLNLADVYMLGKRPVEASQTLRKYLAKNPGNTPVRDKYAQMLIETKQYEPAIAELEYLLKNPYVKPEDSNRYKWQKQLAYAYQLNAQPQKALPMYNALLSEPPFSAKAQSDWTLSKNRALAAHQAGQLEQAAIFYKQLYTQIGHYNDNGKPVSPADQESLRQDFMGVLKQLGESAYAKQDFERAKVYFDDAAQLARLDDGAEETLALQLSRAHTDYASGNLQSARTQYESILAQSPNEPVAKLYLAKIQLQQSDGVQPAQPGSEAPTPEAQPLSQQQLAILVAQLQALVPDKTLSPADKQTLLLTLAQAQQRVSPQTPESRAALKTTYEAILANDANDRFALLGLGQTLHQEGKLKEALSVYQKAAAHYPNDAVLFYNLGAVHHAMASLPQAAAAYQKAIQLDDTLAEPRYGLAVVWESQQRFSEAIASYNAYVKARPEGPYAAIARDRAKALGAKK